MAMLAESKNKTKYSLNPRGLDWVNDESKFGQKLMEKMGWSKGQGLGVNKDGNTDHIHVTVKADKRGVGCSRKAAEEWLDHQDGFSNILEELNAEHVHSNSQLDIINGIQSQIGQQLLSLEHKSRNSSGRIHYKKFTQSKDLSVKNTKDLDCIFGTKARKKNHSVSNYEDINVLEKKHSDFGVKTSTSSLSINQYFISKQNLLKQNLLKQKSNQLEYNISTDENTIEVKTSKCNNNKKEKQIKLNNLKKQIKIENSNKVISEKNNTNNGVNEVNHVELNPNIDNVSDENKDIVISSIICNDSSATLNMKKNTKLTKNLSEVLNLNSHESEVNKPQKSVKIGNKSKSKKDNVKLLIPNDLVNESEVAVHKKKKRKFQKEKKIESPKDNSLQDKKSQIDNKKKIKHS